MNRMNRVSLVIGMLMVLVGIFSSAGLAKNLERASSVDSTVVQVGHWQAMNPSGIDSTVTQVAHRQTMIFEFTDSTVTQVAHWLAMAGLPDAGETVNIDSGSVAEVIVQR